MIIVNREKDVIVNFDNIETLWINNPLENDNGNFEIIAETHTSNMNIGEYPTEERAKEILREIAEIRSLFELAKNRLIDEKTLKDYGDIQDVETLLFDTYEMPLE